jgi:hypothetical protein
MTTRKRRQRIALCIPCDSSDLTLIDTCFKSIKAQTKGPDYICFSLSSVTPESVSFFRQKMKEYSLQATLVSSPDKIFPGENRNRAAAAAIQKGATILTFMDVDDIMHPRRIEIVAKSFKQHRTMTGLVHACKQALKSNYIHIESIRSIDWPTIQGTVYFDCLYSDYKYTPEMGGKELFYTHVNPDCIAAHLHAKSITRGHFSVRSSYIRKHKYRKDLEFAEDNDYIGQMLTNNYTVGYIPEHLSLYLRPILYGGYVPTGLDDEL